MSREWQNRLLWLLHWEASMGSMSRRGNGKIMRTDAVVAVVITVRFWVQHENSVDGICKWTKHGR